MFTCFKYAQHKYVHAGDDLQNLESFMAAKGPKFHPRVTLPECLCSKCPVWTNDKSNSSVFTGMEK